MNEKGKIEEPGEFHHEVVCVPGQQWQHTNI